MDSIRQDVRFFLRTLRRHPGFAFIAILILGLGVGTTTTIFSVVNSVLLKPLSYPEPSQLVAVTSVFRPGTQNGVVDVVELDNLTALGELSESIESVGAFAFTRTPVQVGDSAFLPDTVWVHPGLFATLQTPPALGTDFAMDRAENGPTVIISHAFWQQDLFLYGGVSGANRSYWAVARLAPGATIEQAQAELGSLEIGTDPNGSDDWSLRIAPLAEERASQSRDSLLTFLAIAAVLFLIACVNLMNLLLSRSAARVQEMAIRKSVGGTSARLLRQQLTESVCLFLLGGGLGVGLAAVAVRYVETLSPVRLPITNGITIDGTVLGFTFVVCVASSILTAVLPAFFASAGLAVRRGQGSVTGTTSRVFPRMQRGLSVVQIALCVGLLAAAGVLAHSLWRLDTIDRGFDRGQVLGFLLTVSGAPGTWAEFPRRALDELETILGVRRAGFSTFLPPETWAGFFQPFRFEGPVPEGAPTTSLRANTMMTSAGYFDAVGISVVQGRGIRETDDETSPAVAVVNEAFVRTYFPNEDPIGRRIISNLEASLGREEKPREIVGVVNDTRDRDWRSDPQPVLYVSYLQGMLPYGAIAVRIDVPPAALIPDIRRRLNAIDPSVPLADFQTLDERVAESLKEPRFYALLGGICAFLAVVFATVGIYGVVSYAVTRRMLEFGIRMALGSSAAGVLRNVLGEGVRMALIGSVLGIALALATTRALESLLFDVPAIDLTTLSGSVVIVFAATMFAALVPALRAGRQSPMSALRFE